MLVPSASVLVNCAPDGSGYVFDETWSDPAIPYWYVFPYIDVPPWPSVPHGVQADDGIMGGAFLRIGNETATADFPGDPLGIMWADGGVRHDVAAHPTIFFDNLQPITMRYRARLRFRVDASAEWNTIGDFYAGEPVYSGISLDYTGDEVASQPATVDWKAGLPSVANDAAIDIELEWDPTLWQTRARFNGGSWATVTNSGHVVTSGWACLQYPVTLLFNKMRGGHIDIGRFRTIGRPMYGACDLAWPGWILNSASRIIGYDGGPAGNILGGLTGAQADDAEVINHNLRMKGGVVYNHGPYSYSSSAVTRDWSAQSPIVRPSIGYHYAELRFHAYGVSDYSRLKLHVRAGNTANGYAPGDLLSDAHVPGNSTGLLSSAAVLSGNSLNPSATTGVQTPLASDTGQVGNPWMTKESPGTQTLSLAAVPVGTAIYLDVQGHTDASMGSYLAQPRLGGVWVGFEARDFTVDVGPRVADTVTLSGTCPAGSTPTVVCATATVGTVSNPTSTTWTVQATGLASGANTFTIGVGIEEVDVTVPSLFTVTAPTDAASVSFPFPADGTAAPGAEVRAYNDDTNELLESNTAHPTTGAWAMTITRA